MKSKNFFTKYHKKQNEIFLSKEDAAWEISENDLLSAGKRTTYKGVEKFKYRSISLYPFSVEIDFTLNKNYTDKEKKRLSINKKGKIVHLIGIYSDITYKGGCKYTSCCGADSLIHQKVCKVQKTWNRLYYTTSDKELIKFWKKLGYEPVFKEPESRPDRISFTKIINNDSEANQNYDDVYVFDKIFTSSKIITRKVLIEKDNN